MPKKILIEVEVDGKDAADVLRRVKDAAESVGVSAEKASKEIADKERNLKKLVDRLEPGRVALERYQRQQELLNYGLRTGTLDTQRHADAMKELERRYLAGAQGTKDLGLQIRDLWQWIGGAVVLRQLITALTDTVMAAADAEVEFAKLQGVLQASNNALGLSATTVAEYATALQGLTGVSGDLITGQAAVMATFQSISREVFPQAMSAALDLSAITGNLDSAMRMLGVALESPEEGLTRLRRAGIVFTKSEQESIRTLAEHNDVLGAQQALLDAVEQRVGGLSITMGQTLQGELTKVTEAFGDMREALGGMATDSDSAKDLLEGLALTFAGLAQAIAQVRDAAPEASGTLGVLFMQFETFIPVLGPIAPLLNALALEIVAMGKAQREATEAGAEYLRQHPEFKTALQEKLRDLETISVQVLPHYSSAQHEAMTETQMAALADKVMADEVKRLTAEIDAQTKALTTSLDVRLTVARAQEMELAGLGLLTPEQQRLTDAILSQAEAIMRSGKPSHEALAAAIGAVRDIVQDQTPMVLWGQVMDRIAQDAGKDLGDMSKVASQLKVDLDAIFGFPPPPPDIDKWKEFFDGVLSLSLGRSFSDTILDMMGGADFEEAFANIWQGLWNVAGGLMDRIFADILKGGSLKDTLKQFGLLGQNGQLNLGAAAMLGGGLLWGAGAQRGNPLMGGLGGALTGAGLWASLGGSLSGAGLAGPWGLVGAAIVGAVMGYVSSNSGGRKDFRYQVGQSGASVSVEDMDSIRRAAAAQQAYEAYKSYNTQFRQIAYTLGSAMPDMSQFTFQSSGSSQDPAGVLNAILKGQLPRAILEKYSPYFVTGLEGLGVSGGRATSELWKFGDVSNDFDKAFAAFAAWVNAVKGMKDIRDDLGKSLAEMKAEVTRGSREAWQAQVDETLSEIDRLSRGLSQLTSEEQVSRAQQIANLTQQQYQANLQYLAQIASVRSGLQESTASTLLGWQEERAREGGVGAQKQFYIAQLTRLKQELGGATNAEAVQRIMQQITGYSQSLWSISSESRGLIPAGDLRYGRMAVEQYLQDQQAAADRLLAQWEAETEASNDALLAATQAITDALTGQAATTVTSTETLADETVEREALVDLLGDEIAAREAMIAAVNNSRDAAASFEAAVSRLAGMVTVAIELPAGATGTVTSGPTDLVTLMQRGALPAAGVG